MNWRRDSHTCKHHIWDEIKQRGGRLSPAETWLQQSYLLIILWQIYIYLRQKGRDVLRLANITWGFCVAGTMRPLFPGVEEEAESEWCQNHVCLYRHGVQLPLRRPKREIFKEGSSIDFSRLTLRLEHCALSMRMVFKLSSNNYCGCWNVWRSPGGLGGGYLDF